MYCLYSKSKPHILTLCSYSDIMYNTRVWSFSELTKILVTEVLYQNWKYSLPRLAAVTTLFVLDVVLVDSVKIPLDSDNHLLQAAVTAAAAAATAFDSLEVTELLLPLLLPCLWYSSRTIILSRSEEPDKTLLKRCLLGGALNIVREAPEGMGDSRKSKRI